MPTAKRPPPTEIELLGVARLLARRESVSLTLSAPTPLAEVVRALSNELPALVGTVFTEDGHLLGGHAFSRGDLGLLRNPDDVVQPGDRLLLFSTSAGG